MTDVHETCTCSATFFFVKKKKKNPYNKLHVNLTNGLHAKTVSQTDRQTCSAYKA